MLRNSLRTTNSVCVRGFSTSSIARLAEPIENVKTKTPIDSISSSLFLSRVPIVTPTLGEFEKQYYKYQDELQRRLMWSFPYYYYFKKSSLAEAAFFKNQKWPISKEEGVFYPKGTPNIKHLRERSEKQVINVKEEEDENSKFKKESDVVKPIVPNSRITDADVKKDLKSLERKLDSTLYLIVQDKKSSEWKFPSFKYNAEERISALDEYATENIQNISQKDFNMFTVTNTPIHVVKYDSSNKVVNNASTNVASKEYIIKSHILAGDFVLNQKESQFKDYLWLSGEELPEYLSKDYYKQVEFLLADY
ncbi:mitochondrial 54S ribosomal protein YmL17/YmL30 [Saccharomycopsis crataegensis]|uniref:Large ribosomal subunit protein mL46 n=1 Tax=Saccharomycopsis crataegensis TaxID=43959 RepID=A0AAV5QSX0_9ASCO|nr:mitochondrial 54S ribosomal protein YmL17/YmL30 [Saccharomycopsis crataegensis]